MQHSITAIWVPLHCIHCITLHTYIARYCVRSHPIPGLTWHTYWPSLATCRQIQQTALTYSQQVFNWYTWKEWRKQKAMGSHKPLPYKRISIEIMFQKQINTDQTYKNDSAGNFSHGRRDIGTFSYGSHNFISLYAAKRNSALLSTGTLTPHLPCKVRISYYLKNCCESLPSFP